MSSFRLGFASAAIVVCLAAPAAAWSQINVGLSVMIAPPPLPVYVQPPIPDEGYIWSPGYWAYGADDYYWVPGTWVRPPAVGLLWTPAYWSWNNNMYVFNSGYWGPHVGFYGGVNYGYGYGGNGYQGGYWNHGAFSYNRSVNNFGGRQISNVYNKTVINNTSNHVSYNGGAGGVRAKPDAHEQSYAHERHVAPTPLQIQHLQAASSNRDLRASVNHGKPAIAATNRPAQFSGPGVVAARAAGAPVPERSHQDSASHSQDKRADLQQHRPAAVPAETQIRSTQDTPRQLHQQPERAQVQQVRPQPEQPQHIQQARPQHEPQQQHEQQRAQQQHDQINQQQHAQQRAQPQQHAPQEHAKPANEEHQSQGEHHEEKHE